MNYRSLAPARISTTLVLVLGFMSVEPRDSPAQDDQWENLAPMPTARLGLCAAAVDGKIFAIGGYPRAGVEGLGTVERYDPSTDSWTEMAPMPTRRRWLACTAIGETIYAVGGFRTEGTPALPTVEAYQVLSDTWETVTPLPTPRKGLAAAAHDGKLYVLGGGSVTDQRLPTVEVYDPETDSWSTLARMPSSRAMFTAAEAGGRIYAIGGPWPGSFGVATVEEYDPESDTWVTKTSMPTSRWGLAASTVDGMVYAIGGADGPTGHAVVEAYDPTEDAWAERTSIANYEEVGDAPRWGLATAVVDGRIYAIGGATNPARPPHPATTRLQVYTPPSVGTSIHEELPVGGSLILYPNYPNPFSTATTIRFKASKPGQVRLDIYDLLGRIVHTSLLDTPVAGTNEVVFGAAELAPGLYTIRLEAEGAIATRTAMMTRR